MRILRTLYAAAALLFGFSAAARATAIFDVSSSATLSIAGIENLTSPGSFLGLSVSGESEVIAEEALSGGNASASTGSGAEVTGAPPFLGLDQLAAAEGTAEAVGTTEAFVLTDGFLRFENTSATDSFLITLLLDYALSAAAAVDDASSEDAFSSAFVNLVSDSSTTDFFSVVAADAVLGPPSDDDNAQLFFELLVGPGGSQTVFLSTFADGFADAKVPEASTLSLLFAAFLALERHRRRNPNRP